MLQAIQSLLYHKMFFLLTMDIKKVPMSPIGRTVTKGTLALFKPTPTLFIARKLNYGGTRDTILMGNAAK